MTADEFRQLALALSGAIEGVHMGHPDFRVNGKIFATLRYPDDRWGMVKLSPDEQHGFCHMHPEAFVPVKGAWGRQGSTSVRLEAVKSAVLEEALQVAWRNASKAKKKTLDIRKPY